MSKIHLGGWHFPSGNVVRVWLGPVATDGIRHAQCQWDRWPPSKGDQQHYQEVVAPELMSRVCQYLEIPLAKALLLALEG